MESVVVGIVVLVEYVAEVGDEPVVDVVQVVGLFPDESSSTSEGDWSALQNTGGYSTAGLPVGAVEFVFGVHAVAVQDVGVALHHGHTRVWGCVLVGGDPVARSIGLIPVVPAQFSPGFGVVGVGGDEQKPVGVDTGWVAEGVEGGDEQKVEGFDLLGPRSVLVPAGEGPQQWG